jgi:AAA15 family ATPase/GTPase
MKMINSIEVKNYRNLRHVNVERLGRVNLIIGKNNTGKTSLLESLRILLQSGFEDTIEKILISRQERYKAFRDLSMQIEELNGIFYGREGGFNTEEKIEILARTDDAQSPILFGLRFVKYQEQNVDLGDSNVPELFANMISKAYKVKVEVPIQTNEGRIGLEISSNNEKYIKSFDDTDIVDTMALDWLSDHRTNICNFISAASLVDDSDLDIWWAKIALTDGEDIAVNALKTIEPNIERISQIKELQDDDTRFVVRVHGYRKPVPLRSMGDGMNRILTLILAMINSANGCLLIDEFENGLHYSVQQRLWQIIFHLADELNVQVFATTHSNDTISAFESVVNQDKTNPLSGLLIKLENVKNKIETLVFEPEELKVITDNLIEVRR